MKTWRLITTPAARGAWNMAVDESILEHIGRAEAPPTLRLYAWEPACLSLGHAQPIKDVDYARLQAHGWEVVRRLTGGRAIFGPGKARELLHPNWSVAGDAVLNEPPPRYGHVVVDEAQDLTPMQLRMVARRARAGALTILGDVAQATGPVSYTSWADVLRSLPGGDTAEVEELRHAYRVPREIMDFSLPLLDEIAPGIERPLAYRTGAAPPVVRRVEEAALLPEAYHEAARLARADGLVALIVADELVEPALLEESAFDGVPLLTARQAKGLEFDHVIVVEPALVAAGEQGLRELYVALTRPTRTLVVIHSRPLPALLS